MHETIRLFHSLMQKTIYLSCEDTHIQYSQNWFSPPHLYYIIKILKQNYERLDMLNILKKFMKKFRFLSQANWTDEQWRIHLLNNSHSQSEREEINAIFLRERDNRFKADLNPQNFR